MTERIAEFSRFLIREDRSPATVRSYEWALRDFAEFLRSRGILGLHQVSRQTLEAWQDRLVAVHMKPRSRSLATTAARQFLKWAADHEYCDARLPNWLATVRLRPLQPKPIPPADLARFRDWFGRRPQGGFYRLQALRNRALFFYLLSTGARVSEALQVPRQGFERAVVRQKGGTEKLLVVPLTVQVVIRDYLGARSDRSKLLFVSHPGEHPMDATGVRAVWHHIAEKLGVAPFTTHQLRHTFATELLERGIDAVTVAELLGHHGMQTIRNYAKVGEAQRGRAMQAIEEVLMLTGDAAPDPRTLGKTKRLGRPKFQLVRDEQNRVV